MVRLATGALLSSLLLLLILISITVALSPQPKQRRRLRKHQGQVFVTPRRGERRIGSHKDDYKHNQEDYPPELSDFYDKEEPVNIGIGEPTSDRTYEYNNKVRNPYLETYPPTSFPTEFPTYSGEEVVDTYSDKYSKGEKYAKSKGVNDKGEKQKGGKQKAKGASEAVIPGKNHGTVYGIIYEDGYEETLRPLPHITMSPQFEYLSADDPIVHVDGAAPHHHHDHTHPGVDYDHTHSPQRAPHEDSYHPKSKGQDKALCKDKGKGWGKGKGKGNDKGSKGEKQYYVEELEIMDDEYYDCISKSKAKSKSKGRGSMSIVRPVPAPHYTRYPTLAPVPFGEVTAVPSSTGPGNETEPTMATFRPTDDDGMEQPMLRPTEAIPVDPTEPKGGTVDLVPFGLLYDIDRASVPTPEDFEAARGVIEQYINLWFERGYNGVEGQSTSLFLPGSGEIVAGNTAYSLISGAFSDYTGSTKFQDGFVVPTRDDLDKSLNMAFAPPYVQEVLDLMAAELPAENIMSTVTNIIKAASSDGATRRSSPKSTSFTVQKGILMVAAGSMVVVLVYGGVRIWMESRRQNHIQKSGAFFGGDDIIMGNNYNGFLMAR